MGLLDVYAAQSDTAAPKPLQAVPRTLGERTEATFDATFTGDRYFNFTGARRDMWQRSVDEIHQTTGEAFANPYGAVTSEEMMRLGNQPAIEAERRDKIIQASRAAREQKPDLFDPENIDRYIGEESTRRRDKAASYEGTGNGIGNFIASVGMSAIEPVNVLALALPVTRLPSAAASVIGETFLRNVGREALFQAGANVATQAATEALDFASRSETGTAQTAGEIAANLGGAAVFGGLLGGGVRALHLKWLGLPEKARADAPLEVRDAFRVIEADALYSGQNRLGVDPLLHERYQGRAMDAVMRGRPVDLADLTRTADTPLTALGTILRQQTDRPEILRLVGTPDEGMRDAFARAAALPDSEIAAFAREVKPNSFARLDRVETEIADARARLAEIESRAPAIADLVDTDTGMRLQDIERDLSAPAVSRKERTALEREREIILATVDPNERLPKQAEKAQRAERAALEKEIVKLEGHLEEAKVTADAATGDLKRKLGRYADLAEPQDVVRDLGFTAPADLMGAISRADVLRQARMVREMMPESPMAPRSITPAERSKTAGAGVIDLPPEQTRALGAEVQRILETKGLADDFRAVAANELDAIDRELKDVAAAMNCVMGGAHL